MHIACGHTDRGSGIVVEQPCLLTMGVHHAEELENLVLFQSGTYLCGLITEGMELFMLLGKGNWHAEIYLKPAPFRQQLKLDCIGSLVGK